MPRHFTVLVAYRLAAKLIPFLLRTVQRAGEVIDVAVDIVGEHLPTVHPLQHAMAVFFSQVAQEGIEIHTDLRLAQLTVEVEHAGVDVAVPQESLAVLQEVVKTLLPALNLSLHLQDVFVLQVLQVVACTVVGDIEGRDEIVGNLTIGIKQRQDVELDIAVDTHFRIFHVLAYEQVVAIVGGIDIAEQGHVEHADAFPEALGLGVIHAAQFFHQVVEVHEPSSLAIE